MDTFDGAVGDVDRRHLELVRLVRLVAAENPDYVYAREADRREGSVACSYYPDVDNPYGCLFGAALTRMGLPLGYDQGTIGTKLRQEFHWAVPSDVQTWMHNVQGKQDEGEMSWSECVAFADAEYTRKRMGYGYE